MNYQVLVWVCESAGDWYEEQLVVKTASFDCYLEAEQWGEAECQGNKTLAYTVLNLSL